MLMSVNPGLAFQEQSVLIPLAPIIVVHVQKDFMVMGKYVMVKVLIFCHEMFFAPFNLSKSLSSVISSIHVLSVVH